MYKLKLKEKKKAAVIISTVLLFFCSFLFYRSGIFNIIISPKMCKKQIAAKYNHPETVQPARKLLETNSTTANNSTTGNLQVPVILKMSAIAVIGMKGNKKDIALLEKHTKSADIRLRTAAEAAFFSRKNFGRKTT